VSLTPEQLELRRHGIGASEAPMVLEESPHGGRIALFLRKLGLADEFTTGAQEMGNILEPGVATYYARKTGAVLTPETTLRHPTMPWILATPDRWVNGRQKILQIKCVGQWMAHHWRDDEHGIPDYVRIQVTQEMIVTGARVCDVAALICGTDIRVYQVEFDPELAEMIVEAVTRFWFDHIEPRVMPEPDGSEDATDLLARLYPRHREPLMDATNEMELLAMELRTARANAAAWADRAELREQELKALLRESEGVRGNGWTATWKTNAAGARPFRFSVDGTQTKKTATKKKKAA
jgi:putative phage-type endonuclease